MELTKPLDVLNIARNSQVLVELKNGVQFTGILKTFDIHLNTALDDTKEIVNGDISRSLGRILIRGDMIKFISPQKN